jgi:hypothetical protein
MHDASVCSALARAPYAISQCGIWHHGGSMSKREQRVSGDTGIQRWGRGVSLAVFSYPHSRELTHSRKPALILSMAGGPSDLINSGQAPHLKG